MRCLSVVMLLILAAFGVAAQAVPVEISLDECRESGVARHTHSIIVPRPVPLVAGIPDIEAPVAGASWARFGELLLGDIPHGVPLYIAAVEQEAVVYIDRNGNRDLADDGPPLQFGNPRVPTGRRTVVAAPYRDGQTREVPVWLYAARSGPRFQLGYAVPTRIRASLPTTPPVAAVFTANSADFSGTIDAVFDLNGDGFLNAADRSPERMTVSGAFVMGDARFALQFAADGSTLTLHRTDVAAWDGAGVDVGDLAPNWTFPELGGGPARSLAEFRGELVLFSFWATWYPPSVEALPVFGEAHRKFHDRGVRIVAINVDEDPEAIENFRNNDDTPLLHVHADTMKAFSLYGVEAVPATWLLDRHGRVLARDTRPDDIDRVLEAALSGGSVTPVQSPESILVDRFECALRDGRLDDADAAFREAVRLKDPEVNRYLASHLKMAALFIPADDGEDGPKLTQLIDDFLNMTTGE